jgi:polyphosphate glucokinase
MNAPKIGLSRAEASGPLTLAIDIGGTGLKASVLDSGGRMIVPRVRVDTPYPCHPETLLAALETLVAPLPASDRISAGFPGVVRDGHILTAPHFDGPRWSNYALAQALSERFGKPARVLNDAEVQGLGIVTGKGLEVVLTLGTGVGSAVFSNGRLMPHLELAHHPIHKGDTYNEYIGEAARKVHGPEKWNSRVRLTIDVVSSLLHFDALYLGGGNSVHVAVRDLPPNVHIASNDAGITGGVRLWQDRVWDWVSQQT